MIPANNFILVAGITRAVPANQAQYWVSQGRQIYNLDQQPLEVVLRAGSRWELIVAPPRLQQPERAQIAQGQPRLGTLATYRPPQQNAPVVHNPLESYQRATQEATSAAERAERQEERAKRAVELRERAQEDAIRAAQWLQAHPHDFKAQQWAQSSHEALEKMKGREADQLRRASTAGVEAAKKLQDAREAGVLAGLPPQQLGVPLQMASQGGHVSTAPQQYIVPPAPAASVAPLVPHLSTPATRPVDAMALVQREALHEPALPRQQPRSIQDIWGSAPGPGQSQGSVQSSGPRLRASGMFSHDRAWSLQEEEWAALRRREQNPPDDRDNW